MTNKKESVEFILYFRDSDGEEVGRLWFDNISYEIKFYGLANKSSKIFFEKYLKSHIDNYIIKWTGILSELKHESI